MITGGEASELYEFAVKTLNEIALSVNPLAERVASFPIAIGRNIGPCLPLLCKCSYSVGIVGLVRQQDRTLGDCLQQRLRHTAIISLAGCECETDRSTIGIDNCTEFGGQAATGTSHAAIVLPPFPVAAC